MLRLIIKNSLKKLMPSFRTPLILQMEATECGAAALAIILGYYKRFIPLEELRIACGISRDGSKAVNILKAARHYGLTAQGLRVDNPDNLNNIPLPCIIFWRFNHFVVLEAIKDRRFYINDPAIGRYVVEYDAFNKAFTGIVLTFEKSAEFRSAGRAFSAIDSVKMRLKNSYAAINYVLIASFCLVIPGIIIPTFSKIFIDDILIRDNKNWLRPLLFGMLATAIIRCLLAWLKESQLLRLNTKMALTSTSRLVWHILHLPVKFFMQRYAGDISERIMGNIRITQLLSYELSSNLIGLFTLFFYALAMLLLDWRLALIGMFVALLNSGLIATLYQRFLALNYRLMQDQGKLIGHEMNGLQIIETLKATNNENIFFKRWAGYHASTINRQQQINFLNQLLFVLPQFFNALGNTAILAVGGWLIMRGNLTVGTLVALQSLLASFNEPLNKLLNLLSNWQRIRADLMRYNDVMSNPVDERFKAPLVDNNLSNDISIKLENITFGYSLLDKPIIKNLNFTLPAGKTTAIVGASGSGKSTIAKLIAGLYIPWSGDILLGKQKLSTINPANLASLMAMVEQDAYLFSGSLYENLSLWKNTIANTSMENILKELNILDMVNSHGGLTADINEAGANFSGGQRQALEIARAVIAQPRILILDEATSAVDPLLEKHIYNYLSRQEYTLIIIAHRLSAIRNCDHILVVDQGEIVQQGTHIELLMVDGPYRQLITLEN